MKTMKTKTRPTRQEPMEIDGEYYVSLTEAAEIAHLSNDRFGRLLHRFLIPNGVRVWNTSKNNKGIKICESDIRTVVEYAKKHKCKIIEVLLEN